MSTMWQGCLAHTDYFEMRSGGGHDYGIWVTTPPGYDPAVSQAPVVYVLDGNWAVGLTAPSSSRNWTPCSRSGPTSRSAWDTRARRLSTGSGCATGTSYPPASPSRRSTSTPWR